jgi:hypothetical protein
MPRYLPLKADTRISLDIKAEHARRQTIKALILISSVTPSNRIGGPEY